jgi:VIT1/CCC1 family predicted Fe2+/Mn2+ transporter
MNKKSAKPFSDLDPIDRTSEVVFGTLMAMSFSGTLSVATAGEQDIHTMMVAALGCNLAWGLADAVMYLVAVATEQRRKITLVERLQITDDQDEADRLVAEELPLRLQSHMNPIALDAMRRSLKDITESEKTIISFRSIRDAFQVFLLVALSTFPIVVPFILIDNPTIALRLSNLMGLITLLVSGYLLGRYAGGNAWRFAISLSLIGALLIAAIIALGG